MNRGIRVLQTLALPLGYVTIFAFQIATRECLFRIPQIRRFVKTIFCFFASAAKITGGGTSNGACCVKQTQKRRDFLPAIGRGCRFTEREGEIKIEINYAWPAGLPVRAQNQEAFLWFLNGCSSWAQLVP